MAKPERDHTYKQKAWRKQIVAEKQAAALQKRAKLLREFAEKYRNSSAEQLIGRETWYPEDEDEENE